VSIIPRVESKAAHIERVSAWLDASADSVAQYVVPAQFAYYTKPDERAEVLAGAAFHQHQSEECYRRYRDELLRCRNSDGYCLAAFADLQRQCFAATRQANTLLHKYRAGD